MPTPPPPSILILTPVKNAADCASSYEAGLRRLDYPASRLSLGILEGDSSDETLERFTSVVDRLDGEFNSARIWKRDFGYTIPEGKKRWAPEVQPERRATIARARNHLLFRALDEQDWVLWLDADVIDFPTDIIQTLLAVDRDIVHPHCVKEAGGPTFDRNAWRDRGAKMMDDLRAEGELVELDAVGGTMLLVRADAHRDGLIFPTFYFGRENERIRRDTKHRSRFDLLGAWRGQHRGEIETEGLGIMAQEMGYRCWGLPHVEIRHRDA